MTGGLNPSLNETVEPRGGMREKQKEREVMTLREETEIQAQEQG